MASLEMDAENGREGELQVRGQTYKVHVLDLPTVVESYKTYDDENLVKTGDIGQVRALARVLNTGLPSMCVLLAHAMRNGVWMWHYACVYVMHTYIQCM